MGRDAQGGGVIRRYLYGPLTRLGLVAAVIACAVDQASKLWLLFSFDLANRGIVHLTPFLDFVLTWNTGISYGLFPQDTDVGRSVLLAAKLVAIVLLWIWLARSRSALTALSLGLIIGGAVGNGIDRLHWPGVMDFVLFHVETAGFRFRWYVFNLADAAIVAGVAALLYDSLRGGSPQKRPDPE